MSEQDYNTDRGGWSGPSPEEMAERVKEAGPQSEDWERFNQLRAELFAWIAKELAEDGHCKSYEGAFTVNLPNFFEEKATQFQYGWFDSGAWSIELHCYLIGPHRHYVWQDSSFRAVLQKVERDVRAWMSGDTGARSFEMT